MASIDAESWMKAGTFIGAIVAPIYFHVTNKGGTKITFGQTCVFALTGAVAGLLTAVLALGVAGVLGIKMT
ncbi:MAG: hypothetical protein P4M12_01550 [Gammaproteobacteria bacterium]|nr:hypothetical protein [Gammaproteobacteria bacterium]